MAEPSQSPNRKDDPEDDPVTEAAKDMLDVIDELDEEDGKLAVITFLAAFSLRYLDPIQIARDICAITEGAITREVLAHGDVEGHA